MQLSRWGLLQPLLRSGAPVIPSTTFHYGEQEVTVPIRSEPGIHVFAPISRPELSGNASFLNLFKTHDGVALSYVPRYEEKGRWNVQWDDYESSELTPGPGELGVINERKAVALANATVITSTTYTYGRGWITEFRKFAEAFLDGK